MGFDDLEDAAAEQDADDSERATETQPTSESKQSMREPPAQSTESDEDGWKRHPAFPYDDASQEAIYPRSDTWDEFEDTLDFEVKRELRDAGLRDVPKREYHDALLKLAIEQPERLADLVKEGRQ